MRSPLKQLIFLFHEYLADIDTAGSIKEAVIIFDISTETNRQKLKKPKYPKSQNDEIKIARLIFVKLKNTCPNIRNEDEEKK